MLDIYTQVVRELQQPITRILAESFTGETDLDEISEYISTMYTDMVINSGVEEITVQSFLIENLEAEEKILPRDAYISTEIAKQDSFYFVPQLDRWLWSPIPRY